MLNDLISQGDTIEEAVENGLKKMKVNMEEVDVEIIEEGKTILNVVIKPYRIRLVRKNNNVLSDIEDESCEIVDARAEIEITKDQLRAYVTIFPPKGGEMISESDIVNELEEKNIVYGIRRDCIKNMIMNQCFNTKEIAAEGDIPIHGENGKIIFTFEDRIKIKPKLLENGNVDFKELGIIKNIKKGDILARRVLPTNGIDGKTITGKILKAKPGKTVYFKKGKNVIESEDGNLLIASENGYPKIIDGKVTVLQVYEINGNVDNSTGNICFNGKILVRGNVCTGFTIESEGDVEVLGVVEGATIIAEGDIILHKGMQGQNSGKLISKKNIKAGYMESCYAKAFGSIYADVVLHCVLESKESVIISGRKGMLVGGETRANNEISAKFIGSTMNTITKVEVGVDPEMKQKFESLKQELEVLSKNRESVVKAADLLSRLAKTTILSDEKQEILHKSIRTKEYLEEKIKQVNMDLLDLQNTLQSLSSGRLHVYNIIYPGVKISIGNSVLYVRDSIKHASLIREDGEIKTMTYLGK